MIVLCTVQGVIDCDGFVVVWGCEDISYARTYRWIVIVSYTSQVLLLPPAGEKITSSFFLCLPACVCLILLCCSPFWQWCWWWMMMTMMSSFCFLSLSPWLEQAGEPCDELSTPLTVNLWWLWTFDALFSSYYYYSFCNNNNKKRTVVLALRFLLLWFGLLAIIWGLQRVSSQKTIKTNSQCVCVCVCSRFCWATCIDCIIMQNAVLVVVFVVVVVIKIRLLAWRPEVVSLRVCPSTDIRFRKTRNVESVETKLLIIPFTR